LFLVVDGSAICVTKLLCSFISELHCPNENIPFGSHLVEEKKAALFHHCDLRRKNGEKNNRAINCEYLTALFEPEGGSVPPHQQKDVIS